MTHELRRVREYVAVTDSDLEEVLVQLATHEDLDETARLMAARAGGETGLWIDRLRAQIDEEHQAVWVIEHGGLILGYGRAGWFPDLMTRQSAPARGLLPGSLSVTERVRRRGIGRELTWQRLQGISERANMAWFFTNAPNKASLRLHRELGFRETTRDFEFPHLASDGGVGVLCSVELAHHPPPRRRSRDRLPRRCER